MRIPERPACAHCRTFTRALSVTNPGRRNCCNGFGRLRTGLDQRACDHIGHWHCCFDHAAEQRTERPINTSGNVTLVGLGLQRQAGGNDGGLVTEVMFLRLYSMTIENFKNGGLEMTASGTIAI